MSRVRSSLWSRLSGAKRRSGPAILRTQRSAPAVPRSRRSGPAVPRSRRSGPAVPRSGDGSARLATRLLGAAALVGVGATVWLGLWITPPDRVQGQLVRLVYLHPPVAWVAYLAVGVTALASLLYLWPRTRSRLWDRLAGASGELGALFCALTLATGSIWGRPTWGVWWTWDARLTSTALLLVLLLGYLALRRVPGDPVVRSKRAAIAALIATADVPIVHMSVYWWHTLHQPPTVLNTALNPTIHGSMAWTLLLGFCAFTLAYAWLLVHRFRIEADLDLVEDLGLETAIRERQAEADEQRPVELPVGATAARTVAPPVIPPVARSSRAAPSPSPSGPAGP